MLTETNKELRRKRLAVAAYYFVPGAVFASWASRIPDVKHILHLSNGQLGSVLFAIPIGQLLMMAFSGKLGTIKASIAITIVSSISFFGFLVGPPVIGWLSEATGLRIALSIAACLGIMIALLAGRVSRRI